MNNNQKISTLGYVERPNTINEEQTINAGTEFGNKIVGAFDEAWERASNNP
jgi:hypothetical protein